MDPEGAIIINDTGPSVEIVSHTDDQIPSCIPKQLKTHNSNIPRERSPASQLADSLLKDLSL